MEKTSDLPEETAIEIIDKIEAYAFDIRCDWSDPRNECSNISRLCEKLKLLIPMK